MATIVCREELLSMELTKSDFLEKDFKNDSNEFNSLVKKFCLEDDMHSTKIQKSYNAYITNFVSNTKFYSCAFKFFLKLKKYP